MTMKEIPVKNEPTAKLSNNKDGKRQDSLRLLKLRSRIGEMDW